MFMLVLLFAITLWYLNGGMCSFPDIFKTSFSAGNFLDFPFLGGISISLLNGAFCQIPEDISFRDDVSFLDDISSFTALLLREHSPSFSVSSHHDQIFKERHIAHDASTTRRSRPDGAGVTDVAPLQSWRRHMQSDPWPGRDSCIQTYAMGILI